MKLKCSLHNWIYTKRNEEIEKTTIYRILHEISLGMHYLHSQSPIIIHRDLKSPNILVQKLNTHCHLLVKLDNALHVKITDFGLAKTKEHSQIQTLANVMGTVPWSAPEYLTAKRIKDRNEKGDVFSFGVIAWELIAKQTPWKSSGMSADDIRELVVDGTRLEIPSECPLELKEVISQCWKASK